MIFSAPSSPPPEFKRRGYVSNLIWDQGNSYADRLKPGVYTIDSNTTGAPRTLSGSEYGVVTRTAEINGTTEYIVDRVEIRNADYYTTESWVRWTSKASNGNWVYGDWHSLSKGFDDLGVTSDWNTSGDWYFRYRQTGRLMECHAYLRVTANKSSGTDVIVTTFGPAVCPASEIRGVYSIRVSATSAGPMWVDSSGNVKVRVPASGFTADSTEIGFQLCYVVGL